jgi:hypothetical protein
VSEVNELGRRDVVEPNEVDRFTRAAEDFCGFVDQSAGLERAEFVETLGRHLATLYALGMELPQVAPTTADDLPRTGKPLNVPAPALQTKLGDLDYYNLTFDPWDVADAEPVTASLSDDVRDIYIDLAEGLDALAAGAPTTDVVWSWQFGFDNHWGVHAAHALYAIHWATRRSGSRGI